MMRALLVMLLLVAASASAQNATQDDACKLQFECQPYEGQYAVNCREEAGECVCDAGSIAQCDLEKSSVNRTIIKAQGRVIESSPADAGREWLAQRASSAAQGARHRGIGVYAFAIFVLLAVAYGAHAYLRPSPQNSLRRARAHHRRAEKAHLRGDEHKAQYHHHKAEEYRKRARQ